MLNRNFSIKATLVFSGILAAGLVAPSAIAQVPNTESATLTIPTEATLAEAVPAEALFEVPVEPVLDSSIEPVLDPTVFSEIPDKLVTDSETAMLELLTALDAVPLEDAEALNIEALETDETEADEPVLEPISADSPIEISADEILATIPATIIENQGAASLTNLDAANVNAANVNTANVAASLAVQSNAISALTSALNSNNVLTRLYAADALWNLTGNRDLILPTLAAAATSRDTHARELAISALAQLGAQALPAAPILNERVSDSRTRQIAQDTLSVMRSDRRPRTVLGIIARESRRVLIPPAIRALSGLWR